MWADEKYGGLGISDFRYEQVLIEENRRYGDSGFYISLHSRLVGSYLRELAMDEAKRIRRERIRAQSRRVGTYIAVSPEGHAFYADWGTPTAEGNGP